MFPRSQMDPVSCSWNLVKGHFVDKGFDWIVKVKGNFESLREISEMSELELSINGKQFFDN